jgi:hypothetical protein
MFRRSAMKRWASGARSNGKASATTGFNSPFWSPAISGSITRVLAAMLDWRDRYGPLPSSYDWSRTHARRCGGDALARLAEGEWPAASLVTRLLGTWSAARAVAAQRVGEVTRAPASASLSFARESISLPKPRESTARTEDLRGGESKPEPIDVQVLLTAPPDFAHNSGR